MSLGKWLVVIGLAANITGTYLVGFIVSKHQFTTFGAGMRTDETGQQAQRFGWSLLGFGFALQLVGTVLWT